MKYLFLSNNVKMKKPDKGGGTIMPHALSTNSFKMERRDRVDIMKTKTNVLFRSISINCYTSYNQRIT